MDRRVFIGTLAGGLLAAPLAAPAEQAGKGPVIGLLHPGVPDPVVPGITALLQGLQALGYIEGQNIRLEYRWAGGRLEKLPSLAADLVRLNVDVIYAIGPQAIRVARGASRTIAIVGTDLEGDPVESGFVASYARPGGNITGLFLDLPGLTGKWLQLVREVAPATRRVAALWDATTGPHQLRALTLAAKAAAMELQVLEVRRPSEYEDILKTAMRGRPHALIQLSSPLIRQASPRVAAFTVKNRLPAISLFREFAVAGGLMTYGPDLLPFFRRAAVYIDKILKGARPGDLPAEQPAKYDLVINIKTAKTLGLTMPQSLLLRADEVIQ